MLSLPYTLPHLRSWHDLAKIWMLWFMLPLFFPQGDSCICSIWAFWTELFFHKYCCCRVVLARTRGWRGLWQFLAPGRSHRSDHPKINLSCVWRALFQWGFSGTIFNSPELILKVYRAILPNPALTRELFLPYWLMYNAMLYMAGSHRFSLDAGGPGAVRFTINSSRQRSCKRVIKEMISTL